MKRLELNQHINTIETTIGELIEVIMQIAQEEGVPEERRCELTSRAVSQILQKSNKTKEIAAAIEL